MWITIKQAQGLCKESRGPKTKNGIIYAATLGEFIKKEKAQIFIDEVKFRKYLSLIDKPTISKISRELDMNPGTLKYHLYKHGIEIKTELGRSFIDTKDAEKIKKILRGD